MLFSLLKDGNFSLFSFGFRWFFFFAFCYIFFFSFCIFNVFSFVSINAVFIFPFVTTFILGYSTAHYEFHTNPKCNVFGNLCGVDVHMIQIFLFSIDTGPVILWERKKVDYIGPRAQQVLIL